MAKEWLDGGPIEATSPVAAQCSIMRYITEDGVSSDPVLGFKYVDGSERYVLLDLPCLVELMEQMCSVVEELAEPEQ